MRNTTRHGFLAAAILCCSALNLLSQTTWTGSTNTDWFTAGNWTAGVPDAMDDVTIPDVANDPVILSGTATAKTVKVDPAASLTISAAGSLNVNGSASFSSVVACFLNEGEVFNYGNIYLVSTNSPGVHALRNTATFNNKSGAALNIDNAGQSGLSNAGGATFNNEAFIHIGATTSTGTFGIENQGRIFNKPGAEISIDQSGNAAIMNGQVPYSASSRFNNEGIVTIGENAGVGNYGLKNHGVFDNLTGAQLNIDRTTEVGLLNWEFGSFNNRSTVTIGANASVGPTGLTNNGALINYAGGNINLNNSSSVGIVNGYVIQNYGTITMGAIAGVGAKAIENNMSGPLSNNFSNLSCSAVLHIVSNSYISNTTGTFGNAGLLIENSSGNSNISSNTGIVQNLNGGTFSVGSGNPAITAPLALTSACCTTPLVVAISGDLVICPGGSRVLTASGGSSYAWSTGATTASITVSTAGTYTVTASDGLGCTATASATTSILSTGTISATPNNTGPFFGGYWVCLGSTIDLNSTVPGGVWGAVRPGTIFIDPATGVVTGLTATFSTDTQTVYYKVSAPGCYLATFRTIEVRGLNPGTILGDPPTCNNANSVVTVQLATTGASGGTWASSNPAITISSSGFVQAMGQGTTTISYTVSDFWCTNSTTKVLTFNTYPSTTMTLPASACVNSSIPISVPDAGPGATYNWGGDGIVNVNSNSTTATPTSNGSYAVTVTPSYGCAAVGFGSVQLIAPLVCPSVFNPSNGQNAVGLNIGMLDWNDVPGATGYLVSFGSNAPDYDNLLNGASTATSQIAIPALSPNLTYGYKVTPTGFCNASGCSMVTFSTCLPSFACPANQHVTLGSDCNMLIPDVVSGLVANPGCGALTFTQNPAAGTSVPSSHNGTVQVVITPSNPNVPTCSVTLTGKDLTAPLVECKNYTANLNAAGAASVAPADVFLNGVDNCGTVNLVSVSPNTFTCSNLGDNSVTLTVNDGNGNASTCSATVTVVDAIAPTVVCKNYTANLDAAGTASITTANVFQSGSDNCGTVNQVSVSPNTFTCSNKGANTVTLTVNDGNGNTSTCSATVTVVDAIAPTVTCKNITAFLGSTIPTIAVSPSQILNSASDNCGSVQPVLVSPTAYFCNDIGPHTITLTVVDGSGNTATCTGIVTVADAVKPTVTCRNNVPISVNAAGTVTLSPGFMMLSGNDNCGTVVAQSVSPNTFNCSSLGTHTVVLTVNDTHGNTATCSGTVNVVDAVAPTVTCKSAVTYLNASGTATITPADVFQSGNDNCTPVSLVSVVPNTFSCNNAYFGPNTVRLTVSDGNGNTAGCFATVTVVDPLPPTVTCKNITANLNSAGTVSIAPTQVLDSYSDNCGQNYNYASVTPNVFNCNNLGTNTVTLSAFEYWYGRQATCTAVVTVVDAIAPTVICKDHSVNLDPTGTANISPADVFQSGADNCGTVNQVSVSPNALNCNNLGANTVTLTVNDGHGNTATCSATVTVADVTAPTITCPANTTVNASASCQGQIGAFASASLSDNCNPTPAVTQSPVASTLLTGHNAAQTVTLTANDGNGNTSTCSFTVTLKDVTAPTITCPANTTVNANASCQGQIGAFASASPSDNCNPSPAVTQSPVASTLLTGHNAAQTVTLTANDGNGNTATCSFTVTLKDVTAPTITCPANTTVNANASCQGQIGAFASASLSDNCNPSPVVTQSPVASTLLTGHNSTQTVTLTANDGNGNTATCSFTVTLKDVTAPTVICKNYTANLNAAGTTSIVTANVFQSSTDNCGAVNQISVAPNLFTCSNLGPNTVTLTVNDGNGNASTCSATVTVVDAIAPNMLCKNVTVVLSSTGQAGITPAQVNNGSSDNCSISTLVLNRTNFTCADLGQNPVTLTGTDPSNNSSSCSAIVTVQDLLVPVAKCKNATINLGANGTVTVPATAINNNSTDNCTMNFLVTPGTLTCANIGVNTVTLRVSDAAGNQSTCTALVTIKDATAPTALCKNATVFLNSTGSGVLNMSQVNNGSADNCGITSITLSKTDFNCSELAGSPWPVFMTLKDGSNNTSTCSALITVRDNIAPTAICEDVTVTLNSTGKVVVQSSVLAGGSVDNCSVWSYSPVSKLYTTANIGVNYLSITVKDYQNNPATCLSEVTVLPFGGSAFGSTIEDREQETSQEAMQEAEILVHVFPNPTFERVNVAFELRENQEYNLKIWDLAGRLHLDQTAQGVEGENLVGIDLQDLSAGLYIVVFESAGQQIQRRLVKQRE